MQWSGLAWRLAVLFVLGISFRITLICTIFRPRIEKKKKTSKCSIAVFLGSGGHTSEMMQLIKALPTNRYNSRTYIMTSNDLFSMDKAIEYEKSISIKLSSTSSQLIDSSSSSSASVNLIILPRARNVHQKWLSTPISVLIAFAYSTYHLVLRPTFLAPNSAQLPDVILMNGPGTCVPIVAAVYILRFFGLKSPRLIYVESFARVISLSLTAKILGFFVDRFVVQWEEGIVFSADYQGILV